MNLKFGALSIGIFSILLFNTNGISENILIRIIPILYFLVVLGLNIYWNKVATLTINSIGKQLWENKIIVIFCIMLSISILRSGNPDLTFLSKLSRLIYLLLFLIISLYLASNVRNKKDSFSVFHYGVIIPLFLYSLVNVILWVLNFKPKGFEVVEIGESLVLSKLTGIFIERVNFPLMSGTVSFGFLIGILLITSYFLFLESKKITYVGIIIFSIVLLLLNDSRAVIMSVMIILIFYRFHLFVKLSKTLPFLVIIGPLFLLALTFILQYFEITDIVSRSNSDLETGNSRFIIWLITLDEMMNFKLAHLVGYGLYGTFTSGASVSWAQFFSKFENPLLTTAHNNVFSVFYDLGYIGVFVLLFSIRKGLRDSQLFIKKNIKNPLSLLIVCLIFYYCIAGITDVTIGLYTAINGYYYIFIIIMSSSIKKIEFENKR